MADSLKDRSVNGIFKGGGAKGALYGGALLALEHRGLWFRAVAGASAGAITASLIAAGMGAAEVIAAVPAGLLGVKPMYLGDLVGSPLFRTKRLSMWLESILREKRLLALGTASNDDVSFSELYAVSGIELYVVSVDVADRQPRVFSAALTPTLSVSQAVLASSAIPIAFKPSRLTVGDESQNEVHRMMDGGVWANYPAFVFKDASFRAFHSLPPVPAKSMTIGFTLDSVRARQTLPAAHFTRGLAGASRDHGAFLPWLFRNPLLRFYFMVVTPLVVAAQFWYVTEEYGLVFLKDLATRSGVPGPVTTAAAWFDGFFTHFWPAWVSMLIALLVVAVVAALIGGTLLDSGVPAARTLMAVGTDVPYWVGAAADDHVVRLVVPAWLKTTTFRLTPQQISEALEAGRAQTDRQLSVILGLGPKPKLDL